ncbi:hypothetical protein ABBQ32_006093 [Trebouxia sp. C0010 RCD-2024]
MSGQELTPVLQHAQSADSSLRTQAELQLQAYQQQDYAGYLVALVSELANDAKPPETRQIAGLLLKNMLDATDAALKEGMLAKWAGVDSIIKTKVKANLLPVLGVQAAPARHTAAIVVAKIAAIELPQHAWPELISTLLSNMGQANNSLKQATLQALGYVCEEMGKLDEDVLNQTEINNVLTAVAQGMRPDEADSSVRLAATVALNNALEFAHSNFDNADERNYIMQCICEGAVSPDSRLQEAAFECLVKVAGSYYEKLPVYIQDIFKLSHRAITQGNEEDVAKQAIEFWCTVAEEEIEAQEAQEDGEEVTNHNFIRQALQPLVSMLLEQLTKQEPGQDRDEGIWNTCMAAGICLGLVAQCVKDEIVSLVMPYVQPNIEKKDSSESWRNREAATFAFSSILEGPSYASLAGVVNAGLDFLLNATKDPNPMVRQTTAWTIGRILEHVHGEEDVGMAPLINPQNLPRVVSTLLESTRDEPHIAEQICYALSQLAAGFKDNDTSLFSPYFADIVQALLQQGERALQMDVQEGSRLQLQAFEAINEVVRSASSDTLPLVGQLIQALLDKLASTFRMQIISTEAREHQNDLQGLLCGVLQVVIQKLSENDSAKTGLLEKADSIMQSLLGVFQCHAGSVHEEAMLAVGALTYACGQSFTKYMQSFYPVLKLGLENHREVEVCIATVGVLGDICRAMEAQVAQFSDNIMEVLLKTLSDPSVDRTIKPQILSSFGDIALAVGDKFEPYLPHVLPMLQGAQHLSVEQQRSGNEALFEYNTQLRLGILEAYAGTVHALSNDKVAQYMTGEVPVLLEFIEVIYNDKDNQEDSVTKAAVALLGDLAITLPQIGQLFSQKPYTIQFVQDAATSGITSLTDTATWAQSAISKAVAQPVGA